MECSISKKNEVMVVATRGARYRRHSCPMSVHGHKLSLLDPDRDIIVEKDPA